MESRKECVIAKEMIYTAKTIGEVMLNNKGENERTKTEIRFTWIPGTSPVMIPDRTPRIKAAIISVNILSIIITFIKSFSLLKDNGRC